MQITRNGDHIRVSWTPPTTSARDGGCAVRQSNRPPWVALLPSCSDAHRRMDASGSLPASVCTNSSSPPDEQPFQGCLAGCFMSPGQRRIQHGTRLIFVKVVGYAHGAGHRRRPHRALAATVRVRGCRALMLGVERGHGQRPRPAAAAIPNGARSWVCWDRRGSSGPVLENRENIRQRWCRSTRWGADNAPVRSTAACRLAGPGHHRRECPNPPCRQSLSRSQCAIACRCTAAGRNPTHLPRRRGGVAGRHRPPRPVAAVGRWHPTPAAATRSTHP